MPENNPVPFTWGNIDLSQTVLIDGVPHATRQAIGEWLEYADSQKAIDNLLIRNPHIDKHSVPLNLRGTDDKVYTTKVYHPIGFLLLVMESGQPKAHSMKEAVAEFVWHFAGPQTLTFKQELDLQKLQVSILLALTKTKDAFVWKALTERLSRVCLALGQPMPDVALLGKDLDQLALPGC